MRSVAAVVLAALGVGCASSAPAPPASPSDEALLVSRLLALELPEFRSDGEFDPLAEYKAWEALYGRYFERARTTEPPDDAAVKLFLLTGTIARLQLDAGTLESFTPDLMQVYEARPESVLKALSEVPFLVPSTCHSLGSFFGFEDRNVEAKPAFLAAQRAPIRTALPADLADACIAAIQASD